MNKIWMLSLSYIRKSKSACISLLLIIFVAAILLNLGLLTSLNFNKSFDDKAEELHSSHATAAILQQTYKDKYEDYFKSYPGIIETQKEVIIFLVSSTFKYGDGDYSNKSFFLNASTNRNISPLTFVGEHKETGDRDIYVSYLLHTGGGYELGDKFVINYRDKEYVFNIASFTEDMLLGSLNKSGIGFHLPEKSYIRFLNELNDESTNGVLLQSRLEDSETAKNMNFKKNELTTGQAGFSSPVWTCSLESAITARTSTANIVAVMIVSFALIIIIVSLLIIKFRISSSIEDGMVDIGALKALGYTSYQIISSILLQFILIAFIGSVCGIAMSYAGIGKISEMFSSQTGLTWKQGFDTKSSLISLILILFSVLIITPLSSRRIRKLHPIIALKSGIVTHSFKKNHCPLDKMKGSLNFVLAMKSMFTNLKQNIMITLIIAAISFSAVFGLVMYYNMAVNNKAFINMIGSEFCSLSISTVPGEDASILLNDIKELDDIQKAINYDFGSATINDESCVVYLTDDFALLENNQVYEGYYPKYSNEIAINGHVAEQFGKTIGQTISVKMGGSSEEYLITGLIQSIDAMGMDICLTYDGAKRMQSDYKPNTVYIYLQEGKDVESFSDKVNEKFGNHIVNTINFDALEKSSLGTYVSIVSIVTYTILVVIALVVVMTLYLVIKALIIRRRRDLGIQKALGYTTLALMTQTSMSFMPLVFLGAVIGSIVGSIYINPMLSVLFKGMGAMKVSFIVPQLWIYLMCVGICVLAYAASMLISRRIRKITAYALMVE